jgi:class 3 adenylate cyclase
VVYSEGEIYQYVGDEISISWKLERGARNERCIRCFFAIRTEASVPAPHTTPWQYGTAPVFKAGMHFGPVTRGQVGLVKRQTIFSGDVVNTAAHIQSSCNALGVDNPGEQGPAGRAFAFTRQVHRKTHGLHSIERKTQCHGTVHRPATAKVERDRRAKIGTSA